MSSKRRIKYQKRIDDIFDYYNYRIHNKNVINTNFHVRNVGFFSKHPLRQLFSLLSTITGNGILIGNKHNVSIGSFFSNRYLTDMSDLIELDLYLKQKIDELEFPEDSFNYPPRTNFSNPKILDQNWHIEKVKGILYNWSFLNGFKTRRFCTNPHFLLSLRLLKTISQDKTL